MGEAVPYVGSTIHGLESRIAEKGETGLNFSLLPDHDYM